jgi:DNA-binding protein H-NS
MPTYKEYQQQITELQALAEKARIEELKTAKEEIARIMREYGLSAEDIIGSAKPARRQNAPSQLLYKDPTSGKTWTGRGRTPTWLEGKNREEFRVTA